MSENKSTLRENLEFIIKEIAKNGGEGCINCEYNEYNFAEQKRNYCSVYDKTVTDYDEACEDYCEQGTI